MADLPYIERFYRDWQTDHFSVQETLLGAMGQVLASRKGPSELPPQVTPLPFIFSQRLIGEKARRELPNGHAGGKRLAQHAAARLSDQLSFCAAYEDTKQSYYVDAALWEAMGDVDWPKGTPAQALAHLPLPAFALETEAIEYVFAIWYDLAEEALAKKHLEKSDLTLCISILGQDGWRVGTKRPLTGSLGPERLEDGGKMTGAEIRRQEEAFDESTPREVRAMLNVLLYMAGDDDIVERVGHQYPRLPFKRHQRSEAFRSERSTDIFSDPKEADVGVRLRSALIRYADQREKGEEEGARSGPVPHIRRPHPHLYWTGPGREVPIVKFLGPTLVNASDDDEVPSVKPSSQTVR